MIENSSNEGQVRDNEHLMQNINKVLEEARSLSATLNRGPGGRENSLVITKLQESLHWCLETRWQLVGKDK
jgi:hypothetical protein